VNRAVPGSGGSPARRSTGSDSRPARDLPPATGTSRIRGRVVAADTGQPLRKALVRVTSQQLRDGRFGHHRPGWPIRLQGYLRPAAIRSSRARAHTSVCPTARPGRPNPASHSSSVKTNRWTGSISACRGARSSRVAWVDEFGEPVADATVTPLPPTVCSRHPAADGRGPDLDDQRHWRVPSVRTSARPVIPLCQSAQWNDDVGQLRRSRRLRRHLLSGDQRHLETRSG